MRMRLRSWIIASLWPIGFGLLVGCARQSPLQHPLPEIPVRITKWPTREGLDCYLSEIPEPPEVQPWPEGESDVFRRTMVSKREHDDLLNHVRDMNIVITTLSGCLQRVLTEGR